VPPLARGPHFGPDLARLKAKLTSASPAKPHDSRSERIDHWITDHSSSAAFILSSAAVIGTSLIGNALGVFHYDPTSVGINTAISVVTFFISAFVLREQTRDSKVSRRLEERTKQLAEKSTREIEQLRELVVRLEKKTSTDVGIDRHTAKQLERLSAQIQSLQNQLAGHASADQASPAEPPPAQAPPPAQ
jgi:uncharacterized membrane protein